MIQHRVKHLEPIYIEYINEWMDALVTEDGSKFYTNDLCYHKSIDTLLQCLNEKDKEYVLLWSKIQPIEEDISKKRIFYLTEREFNDYCKESLHFLETSESRECHLARTAAMKQVRPNHIYCWADLKKFIDNVPTKFKGSVEARKLRANWESRAAPNGRGVHSREIARTWIMFRLATANFARGVYHMINLRKYQILNKGRKVILRVMCDRRLENYDEWVMYKQDILEACGALLEEEEEEENRFSAKAACFEMWVKLHQHFVPVTEFKKFLADLEINANRVTLIPDTHFIRQWIELPLKVDYTCATILTLGRAYNYQSIQAQLYVFERLACDIDWQVASREDLVKTQQMQCQIIQLLKECQRFDMCSPESVENAINQISSDSFFSESRKKKMNTPLFMCRNKAYNDHIPMSYFKNVLKIEKSENYKKPSEDDFLNSDTIEIWKARYFFLRRWILLVLSNHEKLSSNLEAAITMQCGFADHEDDGRHSLDFSKIKIFEEMAEKSRIKQLDAPKQKSSKKKRALDKVYEKKDTNDQLEAESRNSGTVLSSSEIDEIGPEVSEVKEFNEKEKRLNDEILDLKRKLAEKFKLLENHENRSKSDGMRIQQLQIELEKSQKLMEETQKNAAIMEANLKMQADKSKKDYKASKTEIHELNVKLGEKDGKIEQLEKELKAIRETVKNEQKKKNSKESDEVKKADKNMKKMIAELEMAKITLNDNSKTILELEKRNRGLEIEKEKVATSSMDSEKNERVQELTKECEELKLERIGMLVDIEELSVKNQELENHIDRLGAKADLLETKENIRDVSPSSSLPTCPHCRNHWLDPEEFPAL